MSRKMFVFCLIFFALQGLTPRVKVSTLKVTRCTDTLKKLYKNKALLQ